MSGDGAPTPVEATSDGGRTWTPRGTLAGISDVGQLVRTGARTVWAVATPADGSGDRVERSDDDGATWRAVFTSSARAQTSIAFASSRVGFASTGAELLRTTDGGSHWTGVGPARIRLDGGRSWDAIRLGAFDGPVDAVGPEWLVTGDSGAVLRSSDGGADWRSIAPANEVRTP